MEVILPERGKSASPSDSPLTHCSRYASIGLVNVISSATIRRYSERHPDASAELERWNKMARHATWKNLIGVRQDFPDADQYKTLLIFNIRHNCYRLIVKVDYRAKLLLVKEFLSHTQYIRKGWTKWAR